MMQDKIESVGKQELKEFSRKTVKLAKIVKFTNFCFMLIGAVVGMCLAVSIESYFFYGVFFALIILAFDYFYKG